ncbi:MAG: LuxR C-terminal-related transcriptional regulator [Bacteroidales bacterium]
MKEKYTKDDKMFELLCSNERLLQVVSRFGIPLGVGEKTIEQVCRENKIDIKTFLAIVNFTSSGGDYEPMEGQVDLYTLQSYLQNTHTYLLNFLLPHIRRHLIDALGSSQDNDVTFLIIKFFDEYCKELNCHMETEDKEIFSKTSDLIAGKRVKSLANEISRMHTSPIEQKLSELKNLIIKYYSSQSGNDMVYNILQHLFLCEYDLYIHDRIETVLLLPEIRRLEYRNQRNTNTNTNVDDDEILSQELSEREKEIIIGVVKGLTNKEIGDKLCISINTVTTHRRNIAKKLNIHSPSGLTIYALVNKFVDIKEINV